MQIVSNQMSNRKERTMKNLRIDIISDVVKSMSVFWKRIRFIMEISARLA